MCQLYPTFTSCCGVSVRIAMIYIAVLAIVTGALLNGVLKKSGMDVSSIRDVINLQAPDNDTVDALRDYALDDDPTEDPSALPSSPGGDSDLGADTSVVTSSDSDVYEDESTRTTATTTSTTTTTTTTEATTTEKAETVIFRHVSSMNRNGLNILAGAFIVLGILLLVANFMNSPDLGFICVILIIAVGITSFVLMVGVVAECARDKSTCLMSQLDWFSGFLVSLFWLIYTVVWLFFAGVVNAYANGTY